MRVYAIVAIILTGPLLGGCEIFGPIYVAIDLSVRGLSRGLSYLAEGSTGCYAGPSYTVQGYYHADNIETAKKTCTDAADGNATARHALGEFHQQGTVLFPRDYVEAWKWYNLSQKAGLCEAELSKLRLANNMTVEEIAEAARRDAAWTPYEPCPPVLPAQASPSAAMLEEGTTAQGQERQYRWPRAMVRLWAESRHDLLNSGRP